MEENVTNFTPKLFSADVECYFFSLSSPFNSTNSKYWLEKPNKYLSEGLEIEHQHQHKEEKAERQKHVNFI